MFRRNLPFESDTGIEGAAVGECGSCMLEVPRQGNYRVAVTIRTEDSGSLGKVTVSTGRGRLAFQGEIPGEMFEHVMVVHVGDHVPEGWSRVCEDRTLTVTVTAEGAFNGGISVREISCPTVYIAETDTLRGGWGRMLPAYTCDRISVSSHFRPGLTPESFRREGHYAVINQYSRPGDFYFFQFGCRGESGGELMTGEDYRRQLVRYIIECRERLISPVLFEPAFWTEGEEGAARECAEACREVGRIMGIPVIEPPYTQFGERDAYETAGAVAEEIVRVCGGYPEGRYRFLAKCLTNGVGWIAAKNHKKIS